MPFDINSSSDMEKRPEKVSLLGQVPGDTGNAQRFVARYRDDARYCHDLKAWFFWDGKRWARDNQGRATKLAKDVIIEFLTEAHAAHDQAAEDFAKNSLDAPRIKALLTLSQDEMPIKPGEFDQQLDLMVFNNGTVDLKSGSLGDFERRDFMTKQVHYDYRADETCPRFLAFLHRLMGAEKR